MKDVKLLTIGLLLFLVVPLLATTTVPPSRKTMQVTFLLTDKLDVQKEKKQLACDDQIIYCIWGHWGCFQYQRPTKCSGGGDAGGGGNAFVKSKGSS